MCVCVLVLLSFSRFSMPLPSQCCSIHLTKYAHTHTHYLSIYHTFTHRNRHSLLICVFGCFLSCPSFSLLSFSSLALALTNKHVFLSVCICLCVCVCVRGMCVSIPSLPTPSLLPLSSSPSHLHFLFISLFPSALPCAPFPRRVAHLSLYSSLSLPLYSPLSLCLCLGLSAVLNPNTRFSSLLFVSPKCSSCSRFFNSPLALRICAPCHDFNTHTQKHTHTHTHTIRLICCLSRPFFASHFPLPPVRCPFLTVCMCACVRMCVCVHFPHPLSCHMPCAHSGKAVARSPIPDL